jgi:hypothetical protein
MIRIFCAAAVAAIVLGGTTPALAQKKSASRLAAMQLECFKDQGGYYDDHYKQYVFQGTTMDIQMKTDAVTKCVAEKTGKPAAPFMRQRELNQ